MVHCFISTVSSHTLHTWSVHYEAQLHWEHLNHPSLVSSHVSSHDKRHQRSRNYRLDMNVDTPGNLLCPSVK